MIKSKKNNIVIMIMILLLATFSFTSCANSPKLLYDECKITNSKLESKSYPQGIVTRYYGLVTFTLTNTTEEMFDIRIEVKIGNYKDNKATYKSTKEDSLDFAPSESRNFSISINGFTSVATIYKINVFEL